MSTSQLDTKDCKLEGRKYVLVSQPSRWQKKRERVVVQSPMLNIPKDVSLVPVRRFNGEQQNVVCYLPRADIEKDSSDAYQRLHVNKSPSSIDAHGTAICDSSPANGFLYARNDRFWIYVDSKTDEYKDTVPVINLRTFQSGVIQVDHVCWFPKIHSTSMCSVASARREQLWTPGGLARKCKLSGSKKYALWSFVVCQYTDGTKPIGKSVMIPAKDNQTEETRYLSQAESSFLFEARRRCMVEDLGGSCPPQPLAFLLPTPPASPKLDINRKLEKRKEIQTKSAVPILIDEDCWARIKDMATRRASQSIQYVPRNRPIQPQRSLSVAGSEDRGRSSSINLPVDDYESDWSSSFDSTSSVSRDVSPLPDPIADAEYSRKAAMEGQRLSDGILLWGVLGLSSANENLEDRPDGHACSAVDPSIARDPTRIRADWETSRPSHNPKLDNLCQNKDPGCPYATRYTCKHFHPDPVKCLLDKGPLVELYDPSPANLRKQWRAWFEANRCAPQQDQHTDHEHCITRLQAYPAGAGDCLLAANPWRNHRCCLWHEKDFDGLSQNFTRAYNKSKQAEAERHRITIFDQSNLVKTESRLPDDGITEDQLDLGGQMLQIELSMGALGSELGHLETDKGIFESDDGHQDVDQFWSDDLKV